MNFEYKVGYLWKSYEEDPGQQSWNSGFWRNPLGRNVGSARAVWSTFDQPTWKVSSSSLEILKLLLETCKSCWGPDFKHLLSFLLFFFSFLFLSLLSHSLLSFKKEKGCPPLIHRPSGIRTAEIITGEVFRRAGTAAYKFQNSDSEDSAQLKSKFLYFQLRLLAS